MGQFRRQVELGPIDYVTLDFLAEITMSIMQKQRARDPETGFARDFIAQVEVCCTASLCAAQLRLGADRLERGTLLRPRE